MSYAYFCSKCGLRLDAPGACQPSCAAPALAPEVEVEEGEAEPKAAAVPPEPVTATELPESAPKAEDHAQKRSSKK